MKNLLRYFRLLLVIFAGLSIAACATMPAKQGPRNEALSWSQRQAQLTPIQAWHIEGAVAIKTAKGGQTASMVWQQSTDDYHIDLFGPLGAGRVTLIGDAKQVQLLMNGKQYQGKTAEALMQQVLGWHLPVSNLYYWIRGLPATTIKQTISFDAYHHISELKQQNWTIDYLRYTAVNGIDLPSKLTLQQKALKVTIIIGEWRQL
jgi:outer membrane lipoprotein LolB